MRHATSGTSSPARHGGGRHGRKHAGGAGEDRRPNCARTRSRCSRRTATACTPCPRSACTRTSGAGTPGPIVLGWASVGEWDQAWGELDKLFSAQWPSGMVPHIVFWEQSDDYFPGPEVWSTGREPATTGLTQPPLPVSAAARLFTADPDRDRAREQIGLLWPRLVAWLAWIERARTGPHLAAVVVHPWESGMDNSPAWDEPLAGHARDLERAPRATRRRDGLGEAAPVDEGVPPLPRHRRRAAQSGMGHRDARWPTARSRSRTRRSPRSWAAPRPISPPSPTRPGRTGATSRGSPPRRVPASPGCGTKQVGWYRAYDVRARQADRAAHRERARGDVRRRQPRPRAPHGRRAEGMVERGEVLRAVVGSRRTSRSIPSATGAGRCGCS